MPDQYRLAEWYREWRSSLRRFLRMRRAVTAADIDDIAQEAFLRLLRVERAELIRCPQAYLFRIATNVCSEWAARSSHSLPHGSHWLDELHDPADPAMHVERSSSDARTRAALARLPARSREILRLLHEEGLNYEQIAGRLGLSRRIVKRSIVHAYATLRGFLAPHPAADTRAQP